MNYLRMLLCFALSGSLAGAAETEVRYLSGTGPEDAVPWEFLCTGGRNSGVWTTIPVPSCWEQQGFGTCNYGVHHRPSKTLPNPPPLADEEGHYRRTFRVPAEWRDRAVRLVFDGVMTDTEVRVNGRSAGPVHQGSFYRFHHDITALLDFAGDNRLEVVVRKKSANESVNRAERIGDYWTFGGIFRPVWLEACPRDHIEWTGIDARADGRFTADIHLGAPAATAGRVTAEVTDATGRSLSPPLAVEFAAGATKATVTGRFDKPALWTAETPNLHRVKITYQVEPALRAGLADTHTVTARFGFRTFEVRPEDGLYLNGTKIILKGVNRHCFNPDTGRTISRAQSYADARLIKEMNMNAVRMSHYQPDQHFLEACDELGLYVLDELAGWQGAYDTPTGTRLIGQLVRRDVNHPSILFWDNGNEGGWNTEVDGEFAKWDLQQRPVLHPWAKFSGVDTDHYEPWDSHVKKSAGPMLYMPTEFLHGLYDGGIGAGLRDYWDVMKKSPTVAGGFFWVFADEGIARTDQGGRIDNAGNLAPDGIVGPHGEKEGSFYTVKEIWSPVQMTVDEGAVGFNDDNRATQTIALKNDYAFTNLKDCTFIWRHVRLPAATGPEKEQILTQGAQQGPDVPPGGTGTLAIPYTWDGLRDDTDRLFVTVVDPNGKELSTISRWTGIPWGFVSPFKPREYWARLRGVPVESLPPDPVFETPRVEETAEAVMVRATSANFGFSKTTGRLVSIDVGGKNWSFLTGPSLLGLKRADRTFVPVGPEPTLVSLKHGTHTYEGTAWIEATYEKPYMHLYWSVNLAGRVELEYRFAAEGEYDILGLRFDLPDKVLKSKRWLGQGPYRVWRNRLEGGQYGVHEVAFNDSTPGETYAYPEFKGYFRDWSWIILETTAGRLIVEPSVSGGEHSPFFGLGKPRDGVNGLLDLPDAGLSFLKIIPAMRNKFHTTDQLGPQSQTPRMKAGYGGAVVFRFAPP